MLTGRVDELKKGKLYGWAFNTENPAEHLVIRIMLGTQVIASGVANLLRPDLPDAGIGEGDHAFEVMVPANVSSFQGLMIIAQSARAGEIALPIATNDERLLDDLFEAFSARYEDALVKLKEGMVALDAKLDTLQEAKPDSKSELPDDLAKRLVKLESRMDAAEVFLVRIDETLSRLENEVGKKERKRLLGIF
jgi:hypothetical protein